MFRLLHHFHLLSAHLGISAVKFYENIVHMTDNTGLHPPIVSYSFQFAAMSSTDRTAESVCCVRGNDRGMGESQVAEAVWHTD